MNYNNNLRVNFFLFTPFDKNTKEMTKMAFNRNILVVRNKKYM